MEGVAGLQGHEPSNDSTDTIERPNTGTKRAWKEAYAGEETSGLREKGKLKSSLSSDRKYEGPTKLAS